LTSGVPYLEFDVGFGIDSNQPRTELNTDRKVMRLFESLVGELK
jgi:hypothetical protein